MSLRFIDKYEIISTLGRGSMGVVYKAQDPEIGRLVAIKTLKSVFMGDDAAGNEALQRFRQESRSAGKLHHPNIVTIFEAGRTENGSPYIVMEYIEGKSLEAMVNEKGAVEPLAALHFLAQIASAIDYAHSQNVIHRDIKPSNIIVDGHFRPFLLDFGVAKLSDTSLTPAGTVVGTPSYMSPEQIRGVALDGRTDIFSFAVVAFEVFTGSRPFPGSDFTSVVSNIIHKEPLTFAELGCQLPSALENALKKGLAKEREKRSTNALEFIDGVAQAFSVIVDGTGLVGGYTAGLTLEDVVSRDGSNRARAQTVVGGFQPGEYGVAGGLPSGGLGLGSEGVGSAGLGPAGSASSGGSGSSAPSISGGTLNADGVHNFGGPTGIAQNLSASAGVGGSDWAATVTNMQSISPGGSPAEPSRNPTLSSESITAYANGASAMSVLSSADRDSLQSASVGISSSDRGRADGERSPRGRSHWTRPLIGMLVLVAGGLGAISFRPELLDSLLGLTRGTSDSDPASSNGDSGDIGRETPTDQSTAPAKPPEPVRTALPPTAPPPTPPPAPPTFSAVEPAAPAGGWSEQSLLALRDEEIAWLLGAENRDSAAMRLAVVEGGKRSRPEFTHALCELAKRGDFKVRIDAMKALARAPHVTRQETLETFLVTLNDQEFLVRGFAAKILATIPSPVAKEALQARLKEEKNAVVLKVLTDVLGASHGSGAGSGGSPKNP